MQDIEALKGLIAQNAIRTFTSLGSLHLMFHVVSGNGESYVLGFGPGHKDKDAIADKVREVAQERDAVLVAVCSESWLRSEEGEIRGEALTVFFSTRDGSSDEVWNYPIRQDRTLGSLDRHKAAGGRFVGLLGPDRRLN